MLNRPPAAPAAPRHWHAIGAVALGLLLAAAPLRAVQFTLGEVKGTFDTTLSLGGVYRLQNPDAANYGTSNSFHGVPGQLTSVNTDDGDLNYGRGWVSEIFKGTHELELNYGNFSALVRGYWFTDAKAGDTLRTPLTDQAKDRVVRGADWLDLYARGKFTIFGAMPFDVRIGRQVLSLGESTFIPNGLNVINPADISKLRGAGTELKEALLPVNMVKASLGVSKNLTLEPFWLLEFRRNELEPSGTYFSTSDFAPRGGDKVFLGFGTLPDTGTLGQITRDKDREGANFNQYGLAVHVLAPALHDTEFGVYYARYASRSPVVSTRTPGGPVDAALVLSTASSLVAPLAPALIAAGIPAANVSASLNTLVGAALNGVSAVALSTNLQPFFPSAQAAVTSARKVALLSAAATARYFVEYPEGIDLYGLSFNTALGKSGISWQGEIGYKRNVPLQIDDVELLFATLSSLSPAFGPLANQLGNYLGRYDTEISGYRRHEVWTAQTTLTQVFGPLLGSQQATLLGEVGGVWVNLPSKDTLRYESPGTFSSANPVAMAATGFPSIPTTPYSAFADSFSWGYQLAGRLDYNNLFPGVNVSPSLAFTHDVQGNTPLPLGNYLRGRKSVNAAVEFLYRNAWSFELRYVNFFGAGRYNLISDRDYLATTVKYSF